MDGKPKLPDNQTIVTKTVKENFPSSPNRFLYSSYNSPSPSDLEWEHAWDFLTNSEFENWKDEDKPKIRKLMSPRKRLEKSIKKIKEKKEKQSKDPLQTSEYFSDGDSSSLYRWKHQDDYEWSKERIKCLGKGIVDVSSEASQPVDSLVSCFISFIKCDSGTRFLKCTIGNFMKDLSRTSFFYFF